MIARAERWLLRFGALAVAVISAAVIWWVWDQKTPVPVIHDEASYLLQAEIFASGRWTTPSPALPEFFEQPHVQIAPRVASKYPPGHALLLSLGALAGMPVLVPLLLTAVTAALLFVLAARLANAWTAVLTWAIWLFSPIVLRFQPSYLSELTTTPLVLGSWLALLQWRATRGRWWLLLLALLVGWGAITRPLTMLVFAIPIGVVVLRDVTRDRRWKDLGAAVAVGIGVLALLPLWSARTTGDWRTSPVEKYRLDYLPFDKIGFVADTTAPRRRATMSPVLVETYDYFLEARKEQTLAALPVTAMRRTLALVTAFFQGARLPLALCAVIGLLAMAPPVRFAVLSAALLFIVHLPYAHWPGWTVYYLETAPVAAFLAALGLMRIAARFRADRVPELAMAATALVMVAGAFGASYWRAQHRGPGGAQLHRQLARIVTQLPRPGILFVRYSPRIMHNPAIVRIPPEPARDSMWVVHDLGPRNEALRRAAPGRQPHTLDVDRMVRPATAP
jgi:4-amino-4-deoxy-L-arabinose transferase-like glycosyltransferase